MATVNSDFLTILIVLGVIGIGLIIFQSPYTQGFVNPPTGPQQCGVNMPPCDLGKKCINGFCRKAEPAPRVEKNPVQLLSDPSDISYANIE
jgi:hypothetical protein